MSSPDPCYLKSKYEMYLLNSTVQPPTAIHGAVSGSFTRKEAVEVVVWRGTSWIELLEIANTPQGTRMRTICSQDTFSVIKGLARISIPGVETDCLVLTSDSGVLVICKFDQKKMRFTRHFAHTYGKSGCRRTGPGHLLAVDPGNRAFATSGLERTRLVYIIDLPSPDEAESSCATVRSPVEANRPGQVTVAMKFLHSQVKPTFVTIEHEFAFKDLNHHHVGDKKNNRTVICANEVEVGINGVSRVCSVEVETGAYEIMPMLNGSFALFTESSIQIFEYKDKKLISQNTIDFKKLITSSDQPYFQDEDGQVWKLTDSLSLDPIDSQKTLFQCICRIQDNLVFTASLSCPHQLHVIEDHNLKKWLLLDSMQNHSPLLSAVVSKKKRGANKEDTFFMFAGFGAGDNPEFSCLQPGVEVNVLAVNPGIVNADRISVITREKYAISFPERTMFLRLTPDSVIEEDVETRFDSGKKYILFQAQEDGGILAVWSGGWACYGGKFDYEYLVDDTGEGEIKCATANTKQLVYTTSNGDLHYFELVNNQLREVAKVRMPSRVVCLAVGPVPKQRQRSRYLAVGGDDSVVRLLSLDPDDRMSQLALQAAAQVPVSVCLTSHTLHVGLRGGVYVSLSIALDGNLGDPESRFLGFSESMRFELISESTLVAISGRKPWLITCNKQIKPLLTQMYSFAPFHTADIPDAMIAIDNDSFAIVTVNQSMALARTMTMPCRFPVLRVSTNGPDKLSCLETDTVNSRVVVYEQDTLMVNTCLDIDSHVRACCQWQCDGVEYLVYAVCNRVSLYNMNTHSHVHDTDLQFTVSALAGFGSDRLLVGGENAIAVYAMGQKRLLRKSELPVIGTVICLDHMGTRVYAGTSMDSLKVFEYKSQGLILLTEDLVKRPVSAMLVLDFDTLIVGDRSGSISVHRVVSSSNQQQQLDHMRLDLVCSYNLHDTVTMLAKGVMYLGQSERVFYGTISGMVGCLEPIRLVEEANTLIAQECYTRSRMATDDTLPLVSLTGRHQLLFRSSVSVQKGVIDNDLLSIGRLYFKEELDNL